MFWEEFEFFQSKTGPFENREHIWVSGDVRLGTSHIWHTKNSLRYTKIFGKLACRVTSKILGIGSAERAWGDVKHLKTNKRSHISAERVKKQSTIYGTHCVTMAKIGRDFKNQENNKPYKFWTEEDMNKEFDIFIEKKNLQKEKTARIFKAWEEEWEKLAITKRDPVNEAKLLQKYGGLQWYDFDSQMTFYSNEKELRWFKEPRKAGVYCLIGYDENYVEGKTTEENDDHIEMWHITDDLRCCIVEHYKKYSRSEIKILELKDKNNQENNNDEEDNIAEIIC